MARSIFNPLDIEGSIQRICSARGPSFSIFFSFLSSPSTIQSIPPHPTYVWHLKNLRSDLSSWRTALSQVPPTRLLTIPWLSLIADSRPDLIGKTDHIKILIIMENIRSYTTKLTPSALLIGTYSTLGTSSAPPAFVTPDQLAPIPQHELPDPEIEEYRPLYGKPTPTPLHVPRSLDERLEGTSDMLKRYVRPEPKPKEPEFISIPDYETPVEDETDFYANKLKEMEDELALLQLNKPRPSKKIEKLEQEIASLKYQLDNPA